MFESEIAQEHGATATRVRWRGLHDRKKSGDAALWNAKRMREAVCNFPSNMISAPHVLSRLFPPRSSLLRERAKYVGHVRSFPSLGFILPFLASSLASSPTLAVHPPFSFVTHLTSF